MFHHVAEVTPTTDYSLLVRFADGKKKQYDVKPLFTEITAFQPLTYVTGLFEQVKVDTGGFGISWNDDIDLSCDELYINGKDIWTKLQSSSPRRGGGDCHLFHNPRSSSPFALRVYKKSGNIAPASSNRDSHPR